MANIIITGANQGIGYYFTEQALKDGNRVAVLDIETDHLKDLAQVFPKQLLCCKADVCDDIQIDTAVKEIVAIDVEDGIVFEYKGIEPIREEDAYNNFRVHLQAKYGKIDSPMKIDVTTGDAITPAAIQYDFPMLFEEKSIPVMAYTLETVLAEKYETIIRRNIGSTRARDYYDLHTLYRSRKSSVRPEILKAAVLHTAMKRDSVQDMQDWKEILKDIREEPAMYLLWDNYVAENKYIRELEFHIVLDTVEEVAKLLDL